LSQGWRLGFEGGVYNFESGASNNVFGPPTFCLSGGTWNGTFHMFNYCTYDV